jgi:PAS domain S-box-containing protein
MEYTILRKDGSRFPAVVYADPIVRKKVPAGIRGIVIDITQHKQAEEKLYMMQFAMDNSADTVFQIAPDARLLYVNQAGCRRLGYSYEELTQMKIHDLDPDYPVEKWPAHWQQFREKGILLFETTHYTKSGVRIPVEISANHLTFGDKEFVISFIRDITERKRAEEALKESEAKFHTVADFTTDWEYWKRQDRQLIYVSLSCERITGYTRQEFLTDPQLMERIVHPDDLPIVLEHNSAAWETRDALSVEFRIIRRDGAVRWIDHACRQVLDDAGTTLGRRASNRDITKRRQVEEILRETNEYLHNLLDYANAPIIVWDPEFRITRFNHAFEHLTGRTENEVIGRQISVLFPEINKDVALGLIRKTLDGERWESVEIPVRHISGATRIVLWNSANIVDPSGTIISTIAQGQDITGRKRAEETIKSALAEKEILLREIHHRVKNNLTGIISLIDLQIGSLSDPVYISHLKDLETRIRSMVLVHESLYLTKDIARINIATYTENLTSYLLQVYGTGTDIRCRIEMGDVTMPIETAIPCGLVISEIVTNSLKYAFPKTFSCAEIRGEPCTITLTLNREGNDYLLKIADNGTGIPEGTDVTMTHSLGLYLIRFIVEHQLMGSLEISPAGGTAYTIRFTEPAVKERNTDE